MMKMSVLMNCMIPLLCHFMYARNVQNTTDFLLSIYDILIDLYDVDVYNKLYETAVSNVLRTAKRNQTIWNMQDIRGINTTVHSLQSTVNVLINIMPKYRYDGNLVHLNYKSQKAPYSSDTIEKTALIAGNSLWDNQQPRLHNLKGEIIMLYRYLVEDCGEGIFCNLNTYFTESEIDNDIFPIWCIFQRDLKDPRKDNGIYMDETESWFTGKGNRHFNKAIKKLVALYEAKGFPVRRLEMKESGVEDEGYKVLYKDEYQMVLIQNNVIRFNDQSKDVETSVSKWAGTVSVSNSSLRYGLDYMATCSSSDIGGRYESNDLI